MRRSSPGGYFFREKNAEMLRPTMWRTISSTVMPAIGAVWTLSPSRRIVM